MRKMGFFSRICGIALVFIFGAIAMNADVGVANAAVSAVVTHSGPSVVGVGDSLGIAFSVAVSGTPNANAECEIKNLTYAWTVVVTGSDGGSETYHGSSQSFSVGHIANNLCQSYSVSASCTVSYQTSPECLVGGDSVADSDSASVAVEGTPCDDGGSG